MSRDLSLRASVSIVAATAVVATAFVVLTWPSDDSDSSDATAQAAEQSVVVTPRAATPAPASAAPSTPTPTPVSGADLDFPKVSGDWTLSSVKLTRDLEGSFGGTGVIAYTGTNTATATFVLVVYSGGRPVATLRGATSRAKPRTSTTVSWVSADAFVEKHDGYTFTAT